MATRHRAFNAVFYPESAPGNWREIVDGWHVQGLTILHDQDGKKPHYHLLLMFSSLKSLPQVHAMTDQLGSKELQPSYDMRASARYLLHLDHPDKHQYSFDALESFSGASAVDLTAAIGDSGPEVIAWIREQGVIEYAKLIDYCLDEKREWYQWASTHSIFLSHYLSSSRYGPRWERQI